MSKGLRTVFLIHAVVGCVFGIPLFLAPGRLLKLVNWTRIDALTSRVLGAALLALAWTSFRSWRTNERPPVVILELEAVFTVLGSIGILRHLIAGPYPAIVWIIFLIFAAWAVVWVVFLLRQWRQKATPS
jgi:hypothetical protein